MRREFERLDQRLRHQLRLNQIHSKVRYLRLVQQTSNQIGADRARNLLRRIADVLARRERRVDAVVVIPKVHVHVLIGRMD